MNRVPKISIVTPVLNGADFVADLVSCLQGQGMKDWEHIVVDGGSSDSTTKILQQLYKDDPRLVLIEEPELGIYPSVIKGMSIAKGKIIGWQNADDLYTPWALQAVVDFHSSADSDWFTGLPGCWDRNGTLRFVRPYGWYPRSLIKRGCFHVDLLGFLQQESIFFTRRIFDDLSLEDKNAIALASLAGDFVFWTKLAKVSDLAVLPTVLSGFRRHQDNRSHIEFERYMDEVRTNGGLFLPRFLAVVCRQLFRTISAQSALRRVEDEDQLINSDLLLDRQVLDVSNTDESKLEREA